MKFQALGLVCGLLTAKLGNAELECASTSIGIDWSAATSGATTASSFGWSLSSTAQCSEDLCAATEYDIILTIDTAYAFWDLVLGGSYSFSFDGAFCGESDICTNVAGGDNGCRAVNYDFQQWVPTTCNEANDYGATTIDYNITYKYGCCNTASCNDDYDFSTCTYETEFGNYVSGLYECWNGVKKDWMKYLICDDDGNNIYEFDGSCKTNGTWDSSSTSCEYVLTCSDDLQTILTNFGECACESAADNGYSGDFITEAMETQWNAYCGNAEISCNDDGSLNLELTYYVVYYSFYLDIDVTLINDTVLNDVRYAVSIATNVNIELVEVISAVDGGSEGRRRLQTNDGTTQVTVTVTTESPGDAGTVTTSLDNDDGTTISSRTGIDSTGGSSTTATETQTQTSDAIGAAPSLAILMIVASVIQTIW